MESVVSVDRAWIHAAASIPRGCIPCQRINASDKQQATVSRPRPTRSAELPRGSGRRGDAEAAPPDDERARFPPQAGERGGRRSERAPRWGARSGAAEAPRARPRCQHECIRLKNPKTSPSEADPEVSNGEGGVGKTGDHEPDERHPHDARAEGRKPTGELGKCAVVKWR